MALVAKFSITALPCVVSPPASLGLGLGTKFTRIVVILPL